MASIQACHIVIFAFNKYPLRPGLSCLSQSVEGAPAKAESWHAQSQGAVTKDNVHLKEMVSNQEHASEEGLGWGGKGERELCLALLASTHSPSR